MIILEDSMWQKLKRFSRKSAQKALQSVTGTKDVKASIEDSEYGNASTGHKMQKVRERLANKKNLELTMATWVDALVAIQNPFSSELYDFLMNSESKFSDAVANVIVKLFRHYGNRLTAEMAINSLNLDNPEYTESSDRIADLIAETKDIVEKRTFVDPTVYSIYQMLFNIKHLSQVKKEVNKMDSNVLKDRIADFWKKHKNLNDELINKLKVNSDLFEPGETIIEIAESEIGKNKQMFLSSWEQEIDKWISKNDNKNK